jgi:hypothetical protein
MNGRRVGVMVLSVIMLIAASIIGCVAAGYVTMVWCLRFAPRDGQDGLAVMMVGLIGGFFCAGATLFFILWAYRATNKRAPGS